MSESAKNPREYFRRWLPWILALIPLAYLAACVIRYSVDVPYKDQWALVPLVEKSYQGTLALQDFVASHNEHRPLFPRLVMLFLIRWSGWNIAYELACNILLAVALVGMFGRQLGFTFQSLNLRRPVWLIPAISLIVFSVHQSACWLLGYHIAIFLNLFSVTLGFFLLAQSDLRPRHLAASLALGWVATLSFSNGVLYWPIALLVLWTNVGGEKKRAPWLWAWGLLGAGIAALYVSGYHRPEYHPSLRFGLEHPVLLFRYIMSYLASPVLPGSLAHAWLGGAAGIGLLTWLGWRLWLIEKNPLRILSPYAALALYGLGTAFLTGLGRAGFNVAQAFSTRYVTFGNLLWITLLIFLALFMAQKPGRRGWAIFCAAGIVLLAASSSFLAREDCRTFNKILLAEREKLLRMETYPDPLIQERAAILRKYRLSLFRNLTT